MAYEPTDAELARYIEHRLAGFEELVDDDFIADSLADHRDLWSMLYSVDRTLGEDDT